MKVKTRILNGIGLLCFAISLLLPVAIPDSSSPGYDKYISYTDINLIGAWYLLFGWYIAFKAAGISWWANVFLLLSWFWPKNLKVSFILKCLAVVFSLFFFVNGQFALQHTSYVGGNGSSTFTMVDIIPTYGYIFWLASLIFFLSVGWMKFFNQHT
jgi:hypothetical protein